MSIFKRGKKALKFYMEPCPELHTVKEMIEENGGKMLKSHEGDSIELVPHGVTIRTKKDNTKRHVLVSYEYIYDSVNQGVLQDLPEYTIRKEKPGTITPASTNRKKYTDEENQMMIAYTEANPGKHNSLKYWERALENGIYLNHSAESLRYHWEKIISKEKYTPKSTGFSPKESSSSNIKINLKRKIEVSESPAKRVVIPKLPVTRTSEIATQCSFYEPEFLKINDDKIIAERGLIKQRFEECVRMCREVSKSEISEREVLQTLCERAGSISETVREFKSRHNFTFE